MLVQCSGLGVLLDFLTLVFPVQEAHRTTGVSPEEGYEDD